MPKLQPKQPTLRPYGLLGTVKRVELAQTLHRTTELLSPGIREVVQLDWQEIIGRKLVARASYKEGEVLWKKSPLVRFPSATPVDQQFCVRCLSTDRATCGCPVTWVDSIDRGSLSGKDSLRLCHLASRNDMGRLAKVLHLWAGPLTEHHHCSAKEAAAVIPSELGWTVEVLQSCCRVLDGNAHYGADDNVSSPDVSLDSALLAALAQRGRGERYR
ncbi:hypothetical protein FOZ62_006608, partial [Perkinsus olseni]